MYDPLKTYVVQNPDLASPRSICFCLALLVTTWCNQQFQESIISMVCDLKGVYMGKYVYIYILWFSSFIYIWT